jgi:hypothetical protein
MIIPSRVSTRPSSVYYYTPINPARHFFRSCALYWPRSLIIVRRHRIQQRTRLFFGRNLITFGRKHFRQEVAVERVNSSTSEALPEAIRSKRMSNIVAISHIFFVSDQSPAKKKSRDIRSVAVAGTFSKLEFKLAISVSASDQSNWRGPDRPPRKRPTDQKTDPGCPTGETGFCHHRRLISVPRCDYDVNVQVCLLAQVAPRWRCARVRHLFRPSGALRQAVSTIPRTFGTCSVCSRIAPLTWTVMRTAMTRSMWPWRSTTSGK